MTMNRVIVLLSILGAVFGCAPSASPSLAEQVMRKRTVEQLISRAAMLLDSVDSVSLDKAEGALLLAGELAPYDPRVSDGMGCVAYRRKDFVTAEFFFKRALENDEGYSPGWAHLALIAEQRGHREAAKSLYEKALKYGPLNFRARNNYAVLLLKAPDPELQESWHGRDELQKANAQTGASERIINANLNVLQSNIGRDAE